jgi:hypothetical protein
VPCLAVDRKVAPKARAPPKPDYPLLPPVVKPSTNRVISKLETVWSFRSSTRVQYAEDGVYADLPYRVCPLCGSRPVAVPDDLVADCKRSGLSAHVQRYGYVIVPCASVDNHLWWPSVNRVYTIDEAVKKGWIVLKQDGQLYPVPDETLFLSGISSSSLGPSKS